MQNYFAGFLETVIGESFPPINSQFTSMEICIILQRDVLNSCGNALMGPLESKAINVIKC